MLVHEAVHGVRADEMVSFLLQRHVNVIVDDGVVGDLGMSAQPLSDLIATHLIDTGTMQIDGLPVIMEIRQQPLRHEVVVELVVGWAVALAGQIGTEPPRRADDDGDTFLTDWVYNNADKITSMIYPSGERVDYTYLAQGTTNSVGGYQTGTIVDAQNRVVEVRLANEVTTNYTYNDWLNGSGRLFSIQSQSQNTGEVYQYQFF